MSIRDFEKKARHEPLVFVTGNNLVRAKCLYFPVDRKRPNGLAIFTQDDSSTWVWKSDRDMHHERLGDRQTKSGPS